MESINTNQKNFLNTEGSEVIGITETSVIVANESTVEDDSSNASELISHESSDSSEVVGHYARTLTPDEVEILKKHEASLVSEFKRNKLELEAAKNWDLFYKRNKTNFYKDRHWTLREFQELSGIMDGTKKVHSITKG